MTQTSLLADRLDAATSARDAAAVAEILHPWARVWHNTDGVRLDRAAALEGIAEFYAAVDACRYADVRRREFPGGYVQQHVLEVRFSPDGPTLRIPCCLVVEIADDQIIAIDEYLDPAPFAPSAS